LHIQSPENMYISHHLQGAGAQLVFIVSLCRGCDSFITLSTLLSLLLIVFHYLYPYVFLSSNVPFCRLLLIFFVQFV